MKHLIVSLFFLFSFAVANDEFNRYLNDKKFQFNILENIKNQEIFIDLLYEEEKLVLFKKDKRGIYQKILDKNIYFCNDQRCGNLSISFIGGKLRLVKFIPNVDDGYYLVFYTFENMNSLNAKLISIDKFYVSIENDTIKKHYIYKPNENAPIIKDFTKKNFESRYMNNIYSKFSELKNNVLFLEFFNKKYSFNELEKKVINKKDFIVYDIDTISHIIYKTPITKKILTKYNNIAYYMQKLGANVGAVYILERIIKKFPNRTVAYYNLGDAYWELGEKKKAISVYKTYIKQMIEKGKDKMIPLKIKSRCLVEKSHE